MWPIAFGVTGMVFGLGGLLFTVRRDRRDVVERRKQLQMEGQHEGEKLSSFVVRQTEAVLHGWEGVNRELQDRAEAIVIQLEACTTERDGLKTANDELRQRVNSLEAKVAALEGKADADRRTIHGLQQEIADLRGTAR